MFSEVLEDQIFPSFLASAKIDYDHDKLKKEIYDVMSTKKSLKISNMGGYQSPPFYSTEEYPLLHLLDLEADIMEFVNFYLHKNKYQCRANKCEWWVNINQEDNYNSIHHHGRSDVIAVFYFDVPSEHCGDFKIMRNDGSTYTRLFSDNTFTIKPEAGRVYIMPGHLWHYVTANQDPLMRERISISYNIGVTV